MPFLRRQRATSDANYAVGNTPRRGFFSEIRDDFTAALLEYVGTTFFLLLAFGGAQASQSEAAASGQSNNIERIMYISLSFGFSLLCSVWLFYRVTGGLFNPDVSLALLLTGVIGPVRFVLYCIAQLVGGITAAAIIYALTPGPLASNTFLGPGVNKAQGVFIEMFITSALVLAILMLAAEKHNSTPFAPIGIGLTLFVCHLWAVYYTGASMNTARAFGPAVVTGFPYHYHWIYWVGPFLGSLLGSAIYTILKHIKYWRFNPRQDTVDFRESPGDPVNRAMSGVEAGGAAANEKPGEPARGRRPNDSAV
ncbi:aquaporin-like protein [Trametes cingulata]|nr:aquaporin-like protein [Trametes cingulata]